jgi:uncharacterized membrane protein YedE/YeeE
VPLILNQVTPIHWALAGAGLAAVTLALLFITNKRLGLSSGLEDLCSFILDGPYFRRSSLMVAREWRLPLIAGLVVGGFLSAVTSGGWHATWALGLLDHVATLSPLAKIAWMFGGGLFIGFGTRLAGGCTSGHGIFGLSNLELPSLITTLAFMAGGIVTTQVLYRVIFHWGAP